LPSAIRNLFSFIGYRLSAISDSFPVTFRPPEFKVQSSKFKVQGRRASRTLHSAFRTPHSDSASTLIIVLWIAFGLVSITLYFAHSMSFELRAADNRVCGLEAEHAIEGAARYVGYVLANFQTNGALPDPSTFLSEAVPVGDAHFWLIARDTNTPAGGIGTPQFSFGIMDEASKLNLNSATSNMLVFLPRMTADLTSRILDWRNTNGATASQTFYAMQHPPYQCKNAPFETIDELRLVVGSDPDALDTLLGEDGNRNGILDPNESDENHTGQVDPGILEYVTVYSREPSTNNGVARLNVSVLTSANSQGLLSLLQTNLTSSRANQILQGLGLTGGGPTRPGSTPPGRGGGGATATVLSASPLQFYLRCHAAPANMTPDEFAKIANLITVTNGAYIEGRININTAPAPVLACLPGVSSTPGLEQTLVNYRQTNPDKLTSIAWVADALSGNTDAIAALSAVDCITTQSFQFSADVAALGPHGRGYRRVRFVFDTLDGFPKIIYRQDLSHLGWALGKDARQTWLTARVTP
jgi:type II secretory pathway component PulK